MYLLTHRINYLNNGFCYILFKLYSVCYINFFKRKIQSLNKNVEIKVIFKDN